MAETRAPAGIVAETLVDVLSWRATHQEQDVAYTFLRGRNGNRETITYGELFRRATRVAVRLRNMRMAGERALLMYPLGLDFIVAYFGCLGSGTIAVPLRPPTR